MAADSRVNILNCNIKNLTYLKIKNILGTGFKKGPITGEILANLVTGSPQKYDVGHFSLKRFEA